MKRQHQINLSPSSLSAWWSSGCPARWKLEREWEPIIPDEFMSRGTLVHSMLEKPNSDAAVKGVTDTMAVTMYKKLHDLRNNMGLRILATELTQKFKLDYCELPIVWTRRIDVLGQLPSGELVIVDYKTSGAGWKVVPKGEDLVAPQSLGFQSIGYLIPNPNKTLADYGIGLPDAWPTKILYLVVGMRGAPQMFSYEFSEEKLETFKLLIISAARAIYTCLEYDEFPTNYGRGCIDCKVRPVCFEELGWNERYKSRSKPTNGESET